MIPERLVAVRALWEAALERPPEEREAFLASAAPDDADLRLEVASLLAAHESTGSPFSRPLAEQFGFLDPRTGPTLTGRMLGAYRVTGELGHGGMGTVYEAVRADDQFTKRVAIKTLRGHTDSAAMLRRFGREREIQAALAHPNIATLLDAGFTDDGIPYIVLEYIDGVPIDEYCNQRRLGLHARLDLFRQVTQAVQHAHRQLVVHRDLKPSNILVTADGLVKLLDFGISKLLDDAPGNMMTEGPRAFTTAYASPEQIRGEPVSTATDVYSLGVLLYRMLTGRQPFDVDEVPAAVAWTTICERTPPAPSTAVTEQAAEASGHGTVERLGRALRGELDAIVMMALRKEPDRRYPTADALGEDVLNHLRGRPVQARPDSARYRIRKMVARNRLATAALALAFLAMGSGTVIALWQAREARASAVAAEAERIVAEQERRTAERVSAFLQEMFASADPSWAGRGAGSEATVAAVVDAAAGRIDTDLADEPAVAEALHRILSSTYAAMRELDKGAAHARRVLELQRARAAPGLEVARSLHDLGTQYYLAGSQDSALAVMQQSYDLFEEAGFPETDDLVFTLNQLSLQIWSAGRPAEAEPYMQRALELRRRLVGDDAVAAIASSNLGLIRDAQGDFRGAEKHFRSAEVMYAALGGREYFERGTNLNNLAMSLLLQDRLEEAERTMREGLAVWERALGPEHLLLGLGRFNLARIELAAGRAPEALATVRLGRTFVAHLPPTDMNVAWADAQEAAVLLELGQLEEAEPLARRAVETRNRTMAATDWRLAEAAGTLGRILVARGRTEEGTALIRRSHESLVGSMGPEHPRTRILAWALRIATASARTP